MNDFSGTKNNILNNRAFTLVELVVSMVLTAILATAVVAVMFPATNIFMHMQKLSRAQMVADLVADSLRKECAASYISEYSDARVVNLPESTDYTKGDDGLLTLLATDTGESRTDGNTLIVRKSEKIVEAIYWNTYITGDDFKEATGGDYVEPDNTVTSKAVYRLFPNGLTIDASKLPPETVRGYLHYGYYNSDFYDINTDGTDIKAIYPTSAYDYTNPFSVSAYNGFTVAVTYSEFTYENISGTGDSLANKRPSYVVATIKVYDSDYAKQSEDSLLYKRDAVLCFANDNIK
ncbi:MAG: type II secretion system GspH family protein [Lachnospiraceae bacterium]|nr:type II secretion system GspH family protein [Lachnospiraceae bacterium]